MEAVPGLSHASTDHLPASIWDCSEQQQQQSSQLQGSGGPAGPGSNGRSSTAEHARGQAIGTKRPYPQDADVAGPSGSTTVAAGTPQTSVGQQPLNQATTAVQVPTLAGLPKAVSQQQVPRSGVAASGSGGIAAGGDDQNVGRGGDSYGRGGSGSGSAGGSLPVPSQSTGATSGSSAAAGTADVGNGTPHLSSAPPVPSFGSAAPATGSVSRPDVLAASGTSSHAQDSSVRSESEGGAVLVDASTGGGVSGSGAARQDIGGGQDRRDSSGADGVVSGSSQGSGNGDAVRGGGGVPAASSVRRKPFIFTECSESWTVVRIAFFCQMYQLLECC